MDEFKKYINQHRRQLDTDEPDDHVFDAIQKRLSSPAVRVVPMFVRWAAAACIILLIGVAIYIFGFNKSDDGQEISKTSTPAKIDSSEILDKPFENKLFVEDEPSEAIAQVPVEDHKPINTDRAYTSNSSVKSKKVNEKPAPPVDPMMKAFADMDKSYASMVSLQLEKVKGTPIYAEDAEYFHVFKKQFQDLTNDEKVLKEETKKNGINDDIITRMINIYQEKISLLKQLQFEINKMNNRIKNSNSDVQQKQTPTYINL